MFECIKDFQIDKYDENGFSTSDYITIRSGSKWQIDETEDIIGGEIHLDDIDGSQWIEVSKETLREYFKEINV